MSEPAPIETALTPEEIRRKHTREWAFLDYTLQFAEHRGFVVRGTRSFQINIARVLRLLEEYSLEDYKHAITGLRQAVLDPDKLLAETPTAYARADGLFRTDGNQQFEWFTFAFCHEVGHNVPEHQAHWYTPGCEEYADQYAREVFKRIGRKEAWMREGKGAWSRIPLMSMSSPCGI